MSRLDDAASKVAPALILGKSVSVDQQTQKSLSSWLAKAAIVGDSRNRLNSVVPQSQRTLFMENLRPPQEWEVWIATHSGSTFRDLGIFQRGGTLNFSSVAPPGIKFVGYAKTTFMGMGQMAALVLSNDLPNIDFDVGTLRNFARRIWPTSRAFTWPLSPTLGDNDANAAADILRHWSAP